VPIGGKKPLLASQSVFSKLFDGNIIQGYPNGTRAKRDYDLDSVRNHKKSRKKTTPLFHLEGGPKTEKWHRREAKQEVQKNQSLQRAYRKAFRKKEKRDHKRVAKSE